jgi:Brp/Blh family beta-carotene 15,15'-monooxygenase
VVKLPTYAQWRNGALLCSLLIGLYALEHQWPLLGLWLFVGFSLTLGMGHGALDVVLLLGQFKPQSRAIVFGTMYLALTLVAGWLLSLSFSWALVMLLVMSVWHFGEAYAQRVVLRLAVGGTSLMAPVLIQKNALNQLIQDIANRDLSWLLNVWSGLAWAWAGLVVLVLLGSATSGPHRVAFDHRARRSRNSALFEIGIVFCLSLVFSPLLQFALYFGLFHCTTHVLRVRRAALLHQGLPIALITRAWIGVMLLTAVMLAALWNWLPNAGGWASQVNAQMLHWLVVALGAVTVPHLLLVGYSNRWLGC